MRLRLLTVLFVTHFFVVTFVACGSVFQASPQDGVQEESVTPEHIQKSNFSTDCMQDLRKVLFSEGQTNFPISPYLDASGKISSGMLEGSMVWLGNFDQCQQLPQARYCLADMQVKVNKHNMEGNQSSVTLRWGICAIDVCNNSEISTHMDEILQGTLGINWLNIESTGVHCVEEVPYSVGYNATIGVFISFITICFLATLVELYHHYRVATQPKIVHKIDSRGSHLVAADGTPEDQVPVMSASINEADVWEKPPDAKRLVRALQREPGCITQFAMCFSIVNNLRRLFDTSMSESTISSLNGMRVLSMAWIILGHTFLGMYATGILENPKSAIEYSKSFYWQPIGNAYFAVDTFLFLGGVLVSYLTLGYMDKSEGKLPWLRYYLHRYLRLTPTVACVMLIWIFVLPHVTTGPLWFNMVADPNCETYWWPNLLYIQNFYPQSMEQQCAGWTWYLALDMQFYVISPIILLCLYKSFALGISIIITVVVLSFVVTATLIGYFNIDINLTAAVITGDLNAMEMYENIVYEKPYCRIAPYLVGVVLGYILHRERGIRRRIPKLLVCGAWVLVPLVGFGTLFRLYWTFLGHPLDQVNTILYGTLSHTLWALALAWVVYSCWHGYAGVVSQILGWPGWLPLSRLTFPVYLIHPLFQFSLYNSVHTAFHVNNFVLSVYYAGVLLLSYVAAILMVVFVEFPILNLEAFILKTRKTS